MKTLIIITSALLLLLSSCGLGSNDVTNNTNLAPNPGSESGEMIEDSSTIILQDNTDEIESGAEGGTESGEEISL